jgi:quercetin dioxygenase-like cupin family protein
MKIEPSLNVKETKVDDPQAKDAFIRVLIGPADGADKFHMRRFRVLPGGYTPKHTHAWEHEVFVLAGEGAATTPNGDKPMRPGDVIFIPGEDIHQFRNTGTQDLEFLCLIPAPGVKS